MPHMPMCVNVFKHIHCMTVTSYGTHLTNKLEGVNHHSGMLDACYAYIYIHMNDYECVYIYICRMVVEYIHCLLQSGVPLSWCGS